MPGLVASVTVGLAYNAWVFYRRRRHGVDCATVSCAIRELRKHPLGDWAFRKLCEHWNNS